MKFPKDLGIPRDEQEGVYAMHNKKDLKFSLEELVTNNVGHEVVNILKPSRKHFNDICHLSDDFWKAIGLAIGEYSQLENRITKFIWMSSLISNIRNRGIYLQWIKNSRHYSLGKCFGDHKQDNYPDEIKSLFKKFYSRIDSAIKFRNDICHSQFFSSEDKNMAKFIRLPINGSPKKIEFKSIDIEKLYEEQKHIKCLREDVESEIKNLCCTIPRVNSPEELLGFRIFKNKMSLFRSSSLKVHYPEMPGRSVTLNFEVLYAKLRNREYPKWKNLRVHSRGDMINLTGNTDRGGYLNLDSKIDIAGQNCPEVIGVLEYPTKISLVNESNKEFPKIKSACYILGID